MSVKSPLSYTVLFIIIFLRITLFASNNSGKNSSDLRGDGMNFVENKGQLIDMNKQLRPDILFTGGGGGTKVYLRKTGVSYVIIKEEITEASESKDIELLKNGTAALLAYKQQELNSVSIKGQRVDMDFVGANENATILRSDEVEGYTNYYYAHCPNGILKVKGYNKIIYQNIYPSIDIVYYGESKGGLKYDIVVKPGGNPNDIKIKYNGYSRLEIEEKKIKIETDFGNLNEWMPKVYQNINGKIIDVKAKYVLENNILHFSFSTYNSSFPLVVDPWVTYYGNSSRPDYSGDITTDEEGNCLVTGSTAASSIPVSAGSFQETNKGALDAFIVKFNPSGNVLWATFYGGSTLEYGTDITTDQLGNCLITGHTHSDDFPLSSTAFQTTLNGIQDIYVVKLDAAGTLVWASYYGGSKQDEGVSITTDAMNNCVITGYTQSDDFPVSTTAIQRTLNGTQDAFILKMDAAGNRLWATYCGGNNSESGRGVAMDASGNSVITGFTRSTDFPVSPGAFQTALNATAGTSFLVDAFLVKFDPDGNRIWSTFFGGNYADYGEGIAIDQLDNIIIVGSTESLKFPITAGCQQNKNGGGSSDFFVAKFNPNGNRLWATFQGGLLHEYMPSCTVDEKGNTYIFGEWEESHINNLPVYACAFQTTFGGLEDQYITKYNSAGKMVCQTYLGGSLEDELDYGGGGIACYKGSIFVTGTSPGDYPVTTNAFQRTSSWRGSITVAKLCGNNCGDINPIDLDFAASLTSICPGRPASFTGNTTSCDTTGIEFTWTFNGATPSVFNGKTPSGINYNTNGNFEVKLVVNNGCIIDSITKPDYITVADIECFDYLFYAPNTFTPNGDGLNDTFQPEGVNMNNNGELLIFNRYGEMIYKTNNLRDGWNGKTTNGTLVAQQDVYVWLIKTHDKLNNEFNYKGHVALIR